MASRLPYKPMPSKSQALFRLGRHEPSTTKFVSPIVDVLCLLAVYASASLPSRHVHLLKMFTSVFLYTKQRSRKFMNESCCQQEQGIKFYVLWCNLEKVYFLKKTSSVGICVTSFPCTFWKCLLPCSFIPKSILCTLM